MTAFQTCLQFTLRWEGGLTDTPGDPGGETNQGIDWATFVAWRKGRGMPTPTPDDLRNISSAEVIAIYGMNYWNPIRGDDLPPAIALMVFDFGVNVGPHRSIIKLQECLGFTGSNVDGWIGTATLGAVKSYPVGKLIGLLVASQITYYDELNMPQFFNGWRNRAFARQALANTLIPATHVMAPTQVHAPLSPTPAPSPSVDPPTPKDKVPVS